MVRPFTLPQSIDNSRAIGYHALVSGRGTARSDREGRGMTDAGEMTIEAAALVAHAEREIAEFDTLIACATGAGSAREVLIRERARWVQERDRASEILAEIV